MADDIKMVIGVQYDGLLKAITATDTLEGKVKKLSGAYARGSASYSSYNKAVTRLAIESNKGAKAQAEARKELLAYGSALRKTTKDEKEAKAVKAALKITEQQRVKSLREEKAAIQQKVAADARNASELKRVRMSVDAVYSAQQKRLNMKKLLKAAVVAETMTTKQAIVALKQYNAAQMSSSKVMGMAKNKMNGNNMAVQQLGYQMGDFAVQVQGGTSAFVAFSQQGAQLAGMLPMIAGPLGLTMGAAVGLSAALGIGIPIFSAVGRMFFEMGDSAKDAKGKIKSMTEVMKGLKDATKEASMELKVLQGGFRDSLEVEGVDKAVELSNKILELEEKIVKVRADQGKLSSKDIANQRRANASAFTLGKKKEALVLQRQEIEQQLEYLLNARSLTEEAEALRAVKISQLDAAADAYDVQVDSQESFEKQLYAQSQTLTLLELENQYTKDSAEYRAELVAQEIYRLQTLVRQKEITQSQAVDALHLFETTQDVNTELAASAKQGQDLADALNRAASAMASLSGFSVGIEKSLAVAVAQTKALVAGANAANSGRIAGMRFDAQAKYNATKSAGVSGPASVEAESIFNKSMAGISDIESQLNIQSGIKADRKASKSGGGGSSSDPVEKLRQQIELNSQLVGLSKEEATVLTQVHAIQNSLGEDRGKYSRETIVGLIEQNEAYKEQQRVIEETKAKQDALATSIASSFGDAFMSVIDGTKSAKDAFKDMARSIIKQLLEVLVVQRLVGKVGVDGGAGSGIAGFIGKILGSANGNVFSGGSQVQAYANGGVVNSPTNFPMSGNKMGLMGEAGPEAIMPLKRGANGKLGVQAEGGGGGDVIHISQSFNFQANGDETVKKLIAQAAPKIAQMTKSSMIDDRRRGGVTKSAFG